MELVPPAFQLTNTISEMSKFDFFIFYPMRKSVYLYLLGPSRVVIIFGETCFLKIAIQKIRRNKDSNFIIKLMK
jgi:hypothetical protein